MNPEELDALEARLAYVCRHLPGKGTAADALAAIRSIRQQLATAQTDALKLAAGIAADRHCRWQAMGDDCPVNDDASACQDIAGAILAMIPKEAKHA